MVLIHGVAGSALIWNQVVDRLAPDVESVAVDLLGYGHSPKPDVAYTPSTHVDAIVATLAAIGVDQPAYVVGLSMGCLLAVELAARHPDRVRAVVALALPYYRDEDEARRALRVNPWTGLVIRAPAVARVVIPLLWGIGRRSPALSRALAPRFYSTEVARESMLPTYHAFASTTNECMVGYRIEPALDVARDVPMAFLHGSADKWCPPERVAALLDGRPNCEFEVVDGVGHNLAVLAPDASAAAIAKMVAASPPS
ncbi:MAG: alpha/beta hydrolase [Actinobacteria bacterium]|nr:alpha/beta hydrolase [Actinomycetota bacterium]